MTSECVTVVVTVVVMETPYTRLTVDVSDGCFVSKFGRVVKSTVK